MQKKYFGDPHFYKNVILIALPVMAQMFVSTFVSLIDNFMVAQLGDIKMSGVNISNQIFFIVQVATTSLATAGGIFLSQFRGARSKTGMQQAFRFKLFMLVLVAIIAMLVIFLFKESLLFGMVLKNSNANEIVPYGITYLEIVLLSFIPFACSISFSTSLRETGFPKLPFIITTIAALINAFLNYCLIYGHFGAPRLEVAGAAYATLIARIVEMFLFILVSRNKDFYVRITQLYKIDFSIFKQIIKKSFWLLFSDLVWAFTEIFINAVYNGLGGSEVVSGMSAGWTICDLFFLTHVGLGTAITVIVGGLLGQNKLEEAKQNATWFRTLSIIVGVSIGIIEALSSFVIVPLVFGQLSNEAQRVALHLICVVAVYFPVWSLTNAQYSILLAGGDSFTMSIIETSINVLICLPAVFLLTKYTSVGPVALYALIKIASIIKPIITHFAIKKGKWVKNLT